MTNSTVVANGKRPQAARGCRVSERFTCDVPVSCQPPSAWGGRDIKWQARLRDVSSSGLCLVLQRRFEPGAGLAIDLPTSDGSTSCTILARVINVRAEPGGTWALGCAFVSPLSEEELDALRGSVPAEEAAPAEAPSESGTAVHGVIFRGLLPDGGVVERYLRTLDVGAVWPPRQGCTFGLRFRGPAGETPAARVTVNACRPSTTGWVLECTFLAAPPAELLVAHN